MGFFKDLLETYKSKKTWNVAINTISIKN